MNTRFLSSTFGFRLVQFEQNSRELTPIWEFKSNWSIGDRDWCRQSLILSLFILKQWIPNYHSFILDSRSRIFSDTDICVMDNVTFEMIIATRQSLATPIHSHSSIIFLFWIYQLYFESASIEFYSFICINLPNLNKFKLNCISQSKMSILNPIGWENKEVLSNGINNYRMDESWTNWN